MKVKYYLIYFLALSISLYSQKKEEKKKDVSKKWDDKSEVLRWKKKYKLNNYLIIGSFVLLPFSIHAFHGLFLPAYGSRQAGMGGAFQAVGGSVMDLESNPSHLSTLSNQIFEFGGAINKAKISYEDNFLDLNNTERLYSNQADIAPIAPLPYIGFATPLSKKIGFGFALYAQGGGGGEFKGLLRNVPNGKTLDEYFGFPVPGGKSYRIKEDVVFRLMNLKATPGMGIDFGPWGIGIGLDFVYSQMEIQRHNKDLTDAYIVPGGFSYRSDPSYGFGGKLGVFFKLSTNWKLAYSFTTRNTMNFNGDIRVDSLDPIRYNFIEVSRTMQWPERHSFGISYHKNSFIFALDIRYIPWSQTFRSNKFTLEYPFIQTPFGNDVNTILFRMNWRDQNIFALGIEYVLGRFILRTGYNYGRTPLTSFGSNPMLGSSMEHHASIGMGYIFQKIAFNFALEKGFPKKIIGSNLGDWSIGHAIFYRDGIWLYSFSHSKTTEVTTLYFGISINWEK
ncbi:MAG: outer membrane protein transport protein [Leptospiraceae bacterium]|nr:outer membrane protein transport protein [Leptospiraceae bacterium]MCP5496800.1 outer membrane protein transport protein [Leptospiraceae bacterium]